MIESPFATVNRNAPVLAVLKSCYPEIKGKNKDYHSPFRPDSDPSLHVYDGVGSDGKPENHCYDFGTLTRYTPIDIYRLRWGVTIKEAAERLNQEYQCGAVFNTRKPDKRRVQKAQTRHEVISSMFSEENAKILRNAGYRDKAEALEATETLWELYAFEEDAPDESVSVIEQRAIDIFGANAVHGELVDAGIESVSDVSILLRKASDFSGIPYKFLWYPFLPVREYSLMAAPGGSGKGMAMALIASYISRGDRLPEETPCPEALRATDTDEPRKVIIISTEETGDTISEKIEISGGNADNIITLDKEAAPKAGLNLAEPSGISRLKSIIESENAILTIIDPIQGFLDEKTDMNRMASVRSIMASISNVAAETNSSILLIGHTRKGGEGELNDSIAGSVDIVNAARSVFCITPDYEDGDPLTDNRLIIHTKANGARLGKTLRFRIVNDEVIREGQAINVPGGRFAEKDELYSEVTKAAIEEARSMKMSVRKYLQVKETELSEYADLMEALRLEGESMERDRESERKIHCEDLPGIKKPFAVTVSKIAPKLAFEGLTITYKEQVKILGKNKAGIILKKKI